MDLHEEIARVAYELYEKRGRLEGLDLDNWLEAERIVKAHHREQEKFGTEEPAPGERASTTKRRVSTKAETKARKTKTKSKTDLASGHS